MAEREGFEPSVPVTAHTISSRAPSASSAISPENKISVYLWQKIIKSNKNLLK